MKRKQLRKLLATALTAAMVTSLAACGGSTQESGNSGTSGSSQTGGAKLRQRQYFRPGIQ